MDNTGRNFSGDARVPGVAQVAQLKTGFRQTLARRQRCAIFWFVLFVPNVLGGRLQRRETAGLSGVG